MGAGVAGCTGVAVRENEGRLLVGNVVVAIVGSVVSIEVSRGVGAGVSVLEGAVVATTVGAGVGAEIATDVLALRVRVERL